MKKVATRVVPMYLASIAFGVGVFVSATACEIDDADIGDADVSDAGVSQVADTRSASGTRVRLVYDVIVPGINVGAEGGLTRPPVQLLPGDEVVVRPISGVVNFNVNGPCDEHEYLATPYGVSHQIFDYLGGCYDLDWLCNDLDFGSNPNNRDPFTGRPHAGLFRPAMLGAGGPAWIGAGTDRFTYRGYGAAALRLGINDIRCGTSPNGRAFNVRVAISRRTR